MFTGRSWGEFVSTCARASDAWSAARGRRRARSVCSTRMRRSRTRVFRPTNNFSPISCSALCGVDERVGAPREQLSMLQKTLASSFIIVALTACAPSLTRSRQTPRLRVRARAATRRERQRRGWPPARRLGHRRDDTGHAGVRRRAVLARRARGDERRCRARLSSDRRRVSAVAAQRRRAAAARAARGRARRSRVRRPRTSTVSARESAASRARPRRAAACPVAVRAERNPTRVHVAAATLSDVPDSAVEMRNQLQYYSPRCAAADANRGLATAAARQRGDTARRAARRRRRAKQARQARYTLQVAAYYQTHASRRARETTEGARIRRTSRRQTKPFRVRIGRYETRAGRRRSRNSSRPERSTRSSPISGLTISDDAVADAAHAAVPRDQGSPSERDPVFPHGRVLRDVLRRRRNGVARARSDADVAQQRRRGRSAARRRSGEGGGRLRAPPRAAGIPRRDLRAGRRSEGREGRGSTRSHRDGHAGRRVLRRSARRLAQQLHLRDLRRGASAGRDDTRRRRRGGRLDRRGAARRHDSQRARSAARAAGAARDSRARGFARHASGVAERRARHRARSLGVRRAARARRSRRASTACCRSTDSASTPTDALDRRRGGRAASLSARAAAGGLAAARASDHRAARRRHAARRDDAAQSRAGRIAARRRLEGTLLSVLDRTGTPMGARLLRQWILAPLTDRAGDRRAPRRRRRR